MWFLKRADPDCAAVVDRIKRVKKEKGWQALLESDLARTPLSIPVLEDLFDALPEGASRLREILQSERYHVTTLGQLVDFCRTEVSDGKYSIRGQDASDEDATFLAANLLRFKCELPTGPSFFIVPPASSADVERVVPSPRGAGFADSIAKLLSMFESAHGMLAPVAAGSSADVERVVPNPRGAGFADSCANLLSMFESAHGMLAPVAAGSEIECGFPLLGFNEAPQTLYVRESYVQCARVISEHRALTMADGSDQEIRNVIIGGAKGIGKSVFGMYLLLDFLRSGEIVLYKYANTQLIIVPRNVKDAMLREVEQALKGPYVSPGAVFSIEQKKSFASLCDIPNICYIHDIGATIQEVGEVEYCAAFRVVLTTPGNTRMKRLVEISGASICFAYMPTWTKEELAALNRIFEKSRDRKRYRTPERIEHLFNIFGGVPRTIFWNRDPEEVLDRLSERLHIWMEVADLISATSYEEIKPSSSSSIGMLYSIESNLMDLQLRYPRMILASKHIEEMLQNRILDLDIAKRESFLRMAEDIPGLQSVRDAILEQLAHLPL